MAFQPLEISLPVYDLIDARLQKQNSEKSRDEDSHQKNCALRCMQVWHLGRREHNHQYGARSTRNSRRSSRDIVLSTMPKVFREPGHRLIGNGWCKMMSAAELTEDDVVSIFAQTGDEQPTGNVDRQNAINGTVCDEHQWLTTSNAS